ncbi:hypothetical protein ACJX0J_018662, partial [Zea mays]
KSVYDETLQGNIFEDIFSSVWQEVYSAFQSSLDFIYYSPKNMGHVDTQNFLRRLITCFEIAHDTRERSWSIESFFVILHAACNMFTEGESFKYKGEMLDQSVKI